MENELHREPATPEEIWNILRAVSEEQQKASRETEEIKKQIKATDKQLEEACKVIKEAGEQIKPEGSLRNRSPTIPAKAGMTDSIRSPIV